MIRFTQGDLLKVQAEALVNSVNCVGVMGRGIALQFKQTFPANFRAYAAACQRGEVQPGRMFVFDRGAFDRPRYIINFPTKRHWRSESRIQDIESGLAALVMEVRTRSIRSIAIPPLGSGLGGLNWAAVRPLIEQSFADLSDVEVLVFEPSGGPVDVRVNRSVALPEMTAGRAALVALIHRYLNALLDPTISLLEVHKLMYFLQEAGESLRLRFAKAPYGPYAENLRHVLRAVEAHLISGYRDGSDAPDKPLQLIPGALEDAARFLAENVPAQQRLNRTTDLVEGFETSYGLE
ncbi:MAG: macro domain-containing protein, partial [Anaerolineae bacterium]